MSARTPVLVALLGLLIAARGTFPMRARVVREAAYPFEPATSKRIVVRVT